MVAAWRGKGVGGNRFLLFGVPNGTCTGTTWAAVGGMRGVAGVVGPSFDNDGGGARVLLLKAPKRQSDTVGGDRSWIHGVRHFVDMAHDDAVCTNRRIGLDENGVLAAQAGCGSTRHDCLFGEGTYSGAPHELEHRKNSRKRAFRQGIKKERFDSLRRV